MPPNDAPQQELNADRDEFSSGHSIRSHMDMLGRRQVDFCACHTGERAHLCKNDLLTTFFLCAKDIYSETPYYLNQIRFMSHDFDWAQAWYN